jgi:ABC-2 type transport system ATP-binding protein
MSHAEKICERVVIMAAGRLAFDGTVDEAKSLLPRKVRVKGEGAAAALELMQDVTDSSPSSDGREGVVEFQLREGADPQQLLKRAFEQGVSLEIFEVVDPNLHEVFVHLVGEEAREAAFR